jgi:hypothetical protein
MALDILITDSHGDTEKIARLFIEDYEYIIAKIEVSDDLHLLKSILKNFYGDSEVYMDDLENLKSEIQSFEETFKLSYPKTVADFITEFLIIVEYAIINRKTVKLVGD